MTDSDVAARRAVEFLEAIGNTPDLDSDVRRWSNTGMRWAWLAGYLAAIEDQATGTPSGTPFPARSREEEAVPEPPTSHPFSWPFSDGWSPGETSAETLVKAAHLLLSAADVIEAESESS